MKVSKSYSFWEFLNWTRRKLYVVLALAIVPVLLYQLGQKWIALPWSVAVLLGTATSFIVGFKNAQTYNRAMEHRDPFEGAANDVPISQISRLVEIELGEILGETDLPPLLQGRKEVIL